MNADIPLAILSWWYTIMLTDSAHLKGLIGIKQYVHQGIYWLSLDFSIFLSPFWFIVCSATESSG